MHEIRTIATDDPVVCQSFVGGLCINDWMDQRPV